MYNSLLKIMISAQDYIYQQMNLIPETSFQSEEDEQIKKKEYRYEQFHLNRYSENEIKERFLDPPLQLPKRSYSLEPDMLNGWKPKKSCKFNPNNVFSISYDQYVLDQIVKELYRHKNKYKQSLAYLGNRRGNSYVLHENNAYQNPYSFDKKIQQIFSSRNGLPPHIRINDSFLKFQSDFEGGNLDVAIQKGKDQFDLFMRIDTNTKGHTNWFYYEISNGNFVGQIKFNICNFRRQKSLYQRGLKPYLTSKLGNSQWHQGGRSISYRKHKLNYEFLDQEDEELQDSLNTFFTMSFVYDFQTPDDTVRFAYCIPYTYTMMVKHLSTLQNMKYTHSLKSLSGLPIPVLEITSQEEPQYNKKVVLLTSRVHPGQSNSSFVAEGIMEFLCGTESIAKQLRKKYVFYIIPMLNPDGVVAGNYRTSLFGKDLNRTFDQSRKFAFPESFHLIELAKELKMKHKKRFCFYIDLHGHSVKKNVFMYGPDFNIQHTNYELCRELPRLLSSITSCFRYYSCIFRITNEKSTTSRAIFNKIIDIPYTYTMESSNGLYFDSISHSEKQFTAKKWKQMGIYLCKALNILKLDEKLQYLKMKNKKQANEQRLKESQNLDTTYEKNSDDEISEGNSDSEPQDEDLQQEELKKLQHKIQGKDTMFQSEKINVSQKNFMQKNNSKQLSQKKVKKQKSPVFLPPINSLNRAIIFSNRHKKKQSLKNERLKNVEATIYGPGDKLPKSRFAIFQLGIDCQTQGEQKSTYNIKKQTRIEFLQRLKHLK